MTTDFCECPGAYEAAIAIPPAPAEEITDQGSTWFGSLFNWIGSVFHAALNIADAILAFVPWSGWAFLALGLLIVLTMVRPRTRNVTNHYHRRSRPQFKPKR
ncbi:hypothetical protein R3X27_24960 [Tropicimonas sp. TH_r6]|uniref:hypothetical protein n=1 Tax=Tropicimonas sp. TH_r6 TaxID=3082085 RepID=UPI00295471D0|nr:hypothetical protein [Tropicimonas sp. TH_r6]MDV7145940.1 hypothetical protein [Tropicimonas sp. TH_r6]